MTTIARIGHTLPYLIPNSKDGGGEAFMIATGIAIVVVIIEPLRNRNNSKKYMDTPLLKAMVGTVISGVIVLVAGILIGQA